MPEPRHSPRIDVHNHWVPPSFSAALEEAAARSPRAARQLELVLRSRQAGSPMRDLDHRIADMDAIGIDVAVLSLPPPGVTLGSRAAMRRLASVVNAELLGAAEQYGGRFAVLVALPLPNPDDCIAELERVAGHPAANGVGVVTTSARWTLDDLRLESVYARLAELGLPLFTHPAIEPGSPAWEPWMLPASLGPVVSSSLGVLRLVLSGMLDRVTGLDLIVPHLGGTIPYLTQRIVDFGNGEAKNDIESYLRQRLYLDTCSFHPPAFRCAMETVGVDRLMLGSDYPSRGPMARAVQDVLDNLNDPRERDLVLGLTAARWFARGHKGN